LQNSSENANEDDEVAFSRLSKVAVTFLDSLRAKGLHRAIKCDLAQADGKLGEWAQLFR
jgi:hypothetical protein